MVYWAYFPYRRQCNKENITANVPLIALHFICYASHVGYGINTCWLPFYIFTHKNIVLQVWAHLFWSTWFSTVLMKTAGRKDPCQPSCSLLQLLHTASSAAAMTIDEIIHITTDWDINTHQSWSWLILELGLPIYIHLQHFGTKHVDWWKWAF